MEQQQYLTYVADGEVVDGSWELNILVTDLQVEKTLRVMGDLHIGGVMVKLVQALEPAPGTRKASLRLLNHCNDDYSWRPPPSPRRASTAATTWNEFHRIARPLRFPQDFFNFSFFP
ncbi:hypothetical protein RRG08_033580 [Elysia crispata]|uniref:Kindlin-2 N-terminal domain-containing protein n=1 Tax=Elysia crispata TaxID=231223 RepID=A0AAE0XP63_9GAST|nr:hypothetical protein RRG08_033580 [Elysia crispata]